MKIMDWLTLFTLISAASTLFVESATTGNVSMNQIRVHRHVDDGPYSTNLTDVLLNEINDRSCNRDDLTFWYKFKSVYDKRIVGSDGNKQTGNCHVAEAYAENNSAVQQEVMTPSKTQTVTKTEQDSFENSLGIDVEVGFKAFFIDVKTTLKYSHTETATRSTSEAETITAPSQKVFVQPFSKIRVMYLFCEFLSTKRFLFDYEIDLAKSIMKCKDREYTFTGNRLVQNSNEKGGPRRNIEHLGDGKFILKNIPVTTEITSYEMDKTDFTYLNNPPQ